MAEPASNGAGSNGAATPSADPEAGPGLDLEDFRSVPFSDVLNAHMGLDFSVLWLESAPKNAGSNVAATFLYLICKAGSKSDLEGSWSTFSMVM